MTPPQAIIQTVYHNEVSGNVPIGEDDSLELLDAIEDEAATDFIEDAERSDLQRIVRGEAGKLPERYRIVMQGLCFDNVPSQKLAEELGVQPSRIRTMRRDCQEILTVNKRLKELHTDIAEQHLFRGGWKAFIENQASSEELALERKERRHEQWMQKRLERFMRGA